MKLKAVQRTANVAWSPAILHPVYLAAGTAAQQLDATFSTTASLELYHINLNDAGEELELVGELETASRFHKLVWGAYGIDNKTSVSGLLMGGAEQGQLFVWDAAKIISKEEPLVHKFTKHSGPVSTLDINPFQINLVASGASESEIFIWDLNSPEKPMTPGTKAQPTHDITCLAWNQQVQHILASSHGGSCIVWDLRKNEPIIKIRDSMSHIKCGVLCWHPEVATQICIASEDDHTPVIQLWDLRSATSPLKSFESHNRGILSMSWCSSDPDLLLSSGKDSRILCWNPNSEHKMGDVVYELQTGSQWSFDVQWCPRNPAIFSSCSFDGQVTVQSIMGDASKTQTSGSMNTSFDPFSQSSSQYGTVDTMLRKPPKWMRRTVGASFAFGGKLVSFGNVKLPAGQQHVRSSRPVFVSQVVTETELVSRSLQLENTLAEGCFTQFCDEKIANSKHDSEVTVWNFLKVNFESDTRQQYLKLLGYTHSSVREQVNESLQNSESIQGQQPLQPDDNADFIQPTVESSPFDAISSTSSDSSVLPITVNSEPDGLITKSLLTANFEAAVDVCLNLGRMAEALILAIAGGPELLAKTQKAFFDSRKSVVDKLTWAIVTQNFESIIRTCDLNNWKEALAIILTYTAGQQFTSLCNLLAERLETEAEGDLAANANICYIVAGNVEHLIARWSQAVNDDLSSYSLQDLVERVMILKNGVELSTQGLTTLSGNCLAEKMSRYAGALASQGCVKTALNYLSCASLEDKAVAVLVDRLKHSLGLSEEIHRSAQKPFNTIDVKPEVTQQLPHIPVMNRQPSSAVNSVAQNNVEPNYVKENGYVNRADVNTRMRQDSGHTETNQLSQTTPAWQTSSVSSLSKKYGVFPAARDLQPSTDYNTYQQYPGPAPQQYVPPAPEPHATSAPSPYVPSVHQPYGYQTVSNYSPSGVPMATTNSSFYTPHSSATGAWNDPPVVKEVKKAPAVDYNSSSNRFEGKFLNPAEYQPVLPPAQNTYSEKIHSVEPPAAAAVAAAPVPSVQTPTALPVEHQILQDVFNRLVQVCTSHGSHNPQIRRKLEDIVKKLESLYMQLHLRKLSPSTVDGLHRIVLAIQQYDYQTALAEHARIVSGGSFTEISAFMPGIKVLLQTALQLQVYV